MLRALCWEQTGRELGPLVQASCRILCPCIMAIPSHPSSGLRHMSPRLHCLPAPACLPSSRVHKHHPVPGAPQGRSQQVPGTEATWRCLGLSPGTENLTRNAQSWRGPGPLGPRHVLVWLRDQEEVETAAAGEGPERVKLRVD